MNHSSDLRVAGSGHLQGHRLAGVYTTSKNSLPRRPARSYLHVGGSCCDGDLFDHESHESDLIIHGFYD